MAELALPEVTSQALLGTRAGLIWRVVLRAAREDRWADWEVVVEEVRKQSGDHKPDSDIQCGHDSIPLVQLLDGVSVDPAAVQIASRELCQGMRLYLDKMATSDRVRWAGRLAKVLDQVHGQTSLRPFPYLGEVQVEDQASIWDAVLSALVTRDRAGVGLSPWSNYLAHLPDVFHQRWQEQLEEIELSEEAQDVVGSVLRCEAATQTLSPERTPADVDAEADGTTAGKDENPDAPVGFADDDSGTADEAVADSSPTDEQAGAPMPVPSTFDRESTGTQASALALRPIAEGKGAAPDAPAESVLDIDLTVSDDPEEKTGAEEVPPAAPASLEQRSERVVHSLERTEQVTFPASGASEGVDEADDSSTSVTVFSERVVAHTEGPSTGRPAPVGWELKGGYAGRPLPGVARVALTVTGLIILVACVRLVLRFLFGLRRRGRMWLGQDAVMVESSTFFLGREMRRVRRSFGPEGLMSVVREVRYPYIYLFIGLFALCFGALTGTIAYLDGRLAGFEAWIRTGLFLIIGGLVVDFVFTVLQATRPGRTTVSVTFKPRTTLRILGVDESAADAFLSELVRKAHASARPTS